MRKILAVLTAWALLLAPLVVPPARADLSRVGGRFVASQYSAWGGFIAQGNASTGTQTITVGLAGSLPDGRAMPAPYAGQIVSVDVGANNETPTLTAVSPTTCPGGGTSGAQCYNVTASFSNAHGAAQAFAFGSASGGLDEAIGDAFSKGGGLVVIDNAWTGSNSNITAAAVFGSVAIEDDRAGQTRYWNPTATGTANLAAPTTLTSSTVGDALAGTGAAATGGFYTNANPYFVCIAYVDIMGNEGPCSGSYSFTPAAGSTNQIGFKAPAASTGAVGYVPYISLTNGTYAQTFRALPTSTICTLTKLESTTPACAVANTLYNQTGSVAVVSALTVNTSPHFLGLATTASTSASYVGITNSSQAYSYAPGSHLGLPGVSQAFVASYVAAGSSATTVPNPVATFTIPASLFNYQGATFRVRGKFTYTDGGDTSTNVKVLWDSEGTDTTTNPTVLCNMLDTATGTAAAYNGNFDCTVTVSTTGATGTALVNGYSAQSLAAGATTLVRNTIDIATAASGSINLTGSARIAVSFTGTGATNNPGAQGLSATIEQIN